MKSRLHRAPKCSTTKCVRIVGQGIPVRLSNADAFQVVDRDHDGEYCTKKFFREWHAKVPGHPARSALWRFPNGDYKIVSAE